MLKFIPLAFLTLFISTVNFYSQAQPNDFLSRVPKLQATAAATNGGAMGCGVGTLTLVTSRGELSWVTGLDAIHVFGRKIVVADLLTLLKARIEFNRTGRANEMSGHVSDLVYVILDTLMQSQDPEVIPDIAELLKDPDEVIHGWAAIALFSLAASDDKLQKQIALIAFPKAALESAAGRSVPTPAWVKIMADGKQ